jgi:hypothetical protein
MTDPKGTGDAKLYVAVLLYESSSDAPDYQPLYEESFVLLHDESLEKAQARAKQLGHEEETQYLNDKGETIAWSLKHVVDVTEALYDELGDETTLYSRHFRDYEAYRQFEPLLSDVTDPES